jgi:hypothetical protein
MGMTEALLGRDLLVTERGKLLDQVLRERDMQSCITPYCYAWFRYEDYIKLAQRRLLDFRRASIAKQDGSQ